MPKGPFVIAVMPTRGGRIMFMRPREHTWEKIYTRDVEKALTEPTARKAWHHANKLARMWGATDMHEKAVLGVIPLDFARALAPQYRYPAVGRWGALNEALMKHVEGDLEDKADD